MNAPRIYLAGPDVFLANAAAQSEVKKKLCASYGFVGVSPADNEVKISELAKHDAAAQISEANEQMIRSCQLLIANLTPFRAPSADVGTAYEMGFARALGMPVFAYTNVAGSLVERTRLALGGSVEKRADGLYQDGYKMFIEDFGIEDNLMLWACCLEQNKNNGIVVSPAPDEKRFTDLAGFETCLRFAAIRFSTAKTTA